MLVGTSLFLTLWVLFAFVAPLGAFDIFVSIDLSIFRGHPMHTWRRNLAFTGHSALSMPPVIGTSMGIATLWQKLIKATHTRIQIHRQLGHGSCDWLSFFSRSRHSHVKVSRRHCHGAFNSQCGGRIHIGFSQGIVILYQSNLFAPTMVSYRFCCHFPGARCHFSSEWKDTAEIHSLHAVGLALEATIVDAHAKIHAPSMSMVLRKFGKLILIGSIGQWDLWCPSPHPLVLLLLLYRTFHLRSLGPCSCDCHRHCRRHWHIGPSSGELFLRMCLK